MEFYEHGDPDVDAFWRNLIERDENAYEKWLLGSTAEHRPLGIIDSSSTSGVTPDELLKAFADFARELSADEASYVPPELSTEGRIPDSLLECWDIWDATP